VSARDFLRFLFDYHCLTPETRAGGRAALGDAILKLQGFEIPAAAWERNILPSRVGGYRHEWLDERCLAGEVSWARLTPRRAPADAVTSTCRATPVTIAYRRDLTWLLAAVRDRLSPEPPTGGTAAAVLHELERRGALFFDDLAAASGVPPAELTKAIWDLVARGVVTSDGYEPLRGLLGRHRRPTQRGHRSHGRWWVLASVESGTAIRETLADEVAGQLLRRYGVVFREVTQRESFAVPWRDVLKALRRREARGLVRGGRFVVGFLGEQFALPEALDALRQVRRRDRTDTLVRIRASDPCNLVGIVTPGPRVSAHHGRDLVFRDAELVDTLESRTGPAMRPSPHPVGAAGFEPTTP
jgi:ATP-dependent Lhr-like helicase